MPTSTDEVKFENTKNRTNARVLPAPTNAAESVYDRLSKILDYDLRSIVPVEEAWYWTRTWTQAEAEAEASYAAGRTKVFDNLDDFFTELDDDD